MKNNRSSRTFVLGDLHGAYIPLKQVLNKSNFDYDKDTLIFIGDLADRWPEPHLCLELLMKCKNLIPILGNHDLFIKKWLEKDIIDERWIKMGGEQTIEFLNGYQDLLLEYFNNAVYYHIVDNKFFCHAGFNHKRVITKQKKLTFAVNRQMYKTAKKYAKQGIKFKPIYDNDNSVKIDEIFIGHTPTKKHIPDFCSNLVNVDSGAGNGGKLTLMNIYNKQYVQAMPSSKCYEKVCEY